jgi:transcription antitermination factor NusB
MSNADPRLVSRGLALQVLYEIDCAGHPATKVVESYSNITIPADDARSSAYMSLLAFYDEAIEAPPADEDYVLTEVAYRPSSRIYQRLKYLVDGILDTQDLLDEVINRHATEWPSDQLAIIDRNILRIALYEAILGPRLVPIEVAINEAVELAKLFGAENSPKFINGVLGVVAENRHDLRDELRSLLKARTSIDDQNLMMP